jgi:hypothetical protein
MLALLALLSTLPACFYQYDTPLGTPTTATLDTKLLGTWRCVSGDQDKAALISFRAFDERQYGVTFDPEGEKAGSLRAFAAPIAGVLNVQEVDETPAASRKWGLARYRLIGSGALVVDLLKDDALAGVAPAVAVETLRKRVDDPALYDSFVVCARVVKSDSPQPKP